MDPVRAIADAVLYEGYVLWPYGRSALKNQRRWTFGGVYPEGHSRVHPDDACLMRTQVRFEGDVDDVSVTVRCLQVVKREVLDGERPVDSLVVDGERYLAWDEAVEREFGPGPIAVPAGSAREGVLRRSWEALAGAVDVETEPGRITVTIRNTSPWEGDDREGALRCTFCSTHTVLRAPRGRFVSATEAEGCENVGTWPVLVGDGTMLSSPIILEDNPRIAPESPGDLFDGGEIDGLLALNIMSLTDAEKADMRDSDPRTRAILERTEALTQDQLMRLYGYRVER
jgi:hypothetical protein